MDGRMDKHERQRASAGPAVIDSYMGGQLLKCFEEQVQKALSRSPHALRREEMDLLHLLEHRAKLAA